MIIYDVLLNYYIHDCYIQLIYLVRFCAVCMHWYNQIFWVSTDFSYRYVVLVFIVFWMFLSCYNNTFPVITPCMSILIITDISLCSLYQALVRGYVTARRRCS